MAYHKAKEEKKWRQEKDAEEKALRHDGVPEEMIDELRAYDWAVFNSDRRYYERRQDIESLNLIVEDEILTDIKSVEDFLNGLENEKLYQLLVTVDGTTLKIIILKIHGFSTQEIAKRLNLEDQEVYGRWRRLKDRLKRFLKFY